MNLFENAVFGLFKPDCTEFTEENALMTAKSDDKGCFSFADIPFGEFAVREIKKLRQDIFCQIRCIR